MDFWILDSRFQIPDSRIPRVPDPKFQGRFEISRFQNSKGSRLGIPNRVAIASSRYHLR
ncbi:MAG: hypothetical protein IPN69_15980 [Acidobacteria bacterium]|nr:hypothetical protein [Acidobacteriota bacterium]